MRRAVMGTALNRMPFTGCWNHAVQDRILICFPDVLRRDGMHGVSDPRHFDFGEQMRMSEGEAENARIETILRANIPGTLNVHGAHQVNDRTR